MKRLVNLVQFTWAGRIIIVVILVVSAFALYWSLNTRLALLYGSRSLLQQISSVEADINSLQLQWKSENADQITTDLVQRESKLVMRDNSVVVAWLNGIVQAAKVEGISIEYVTKKVKLSNRYHDLQEVPVIISIGPDRAMRSDLAYKLLVEFAHHLLSESGYRMHLERIAAKGDGRVLQNITFYLTVMTYAKAGVAGKVL